MFDWSVKTKKKALVTAPFFMVFCLRVKALMASDPAD